MSERPSVATILAWTVLFPLGLAAHEALHYWAGRLVGADVGIRWYGGRPAVVLAWDDPVWSDLAVAHLAPGLVGGPLLGAFLALGGVGVLAVDVWLGLNLLALAIPSGDDLAPLHG